ncbi:MAG: putative lipid II flippase FtsW [bacterium]
MERYQKERRKPNYKIAIVAFALAVFGLIMIASASTVVAFEKFNDQSNYYYVWKQLIALAIGFIAMSLFSNFDYRALRKTSLTLMVITLLLLVAVFVPGIGDAAKGASRWINIGFSFQPSELAKVTFVIYLASWLDSKKYELNKLSKALIPFTLMLAVISFLIILEPDLGTLTIIILTSTVMFFVAGAPIWHLGSLFAFMVLTFLGFIKSASYRWERFMTFLNPSAETLDRSYHVNQAFIAVSQGGLWGKGFGQSLQKMRYLPEPHTDSIFAIICEELGFFRAGIVIFGYLYLFYQGIKTASRVRDNFGRLLAIGIVSSLLIQAFINISAMLGLIPLTGVTLPFISYGGTSLVISFIQIGILLNISKYAQED